jgi:hypothetical protein
MHMVRVVRARRGGKAGCWLERVMRGGIKGGGRRDDNMDGDGCGSDNLVLAATTAAVVPAIWCLRRVADTWLLPVGKKRMQMMGGGMAG